MKANWKIALMCVATLAMVACSDKKKEPTPGEPSADFKSKVSVTDGSIAEWANLPAEYVVSATCPNDAALLGLKSMKVYADQLYINVLLEYNKEDITDLSWVPVHFYLNTDNSDATGGYIDQYTDGNTDILLEGAVFSEDEACNYDASVFRWWGEVGGSGWEWMDPNGANDESDCWGAIVCGGDMPIVKSQLVDGKFEMQIMRDLIPCKNFAPWSTTEFGIGVDIQQSWNSVGVLPLVSPTEDNANGYTHKLQVKIDWSE